MRMKKLSKRYVRCEDCGEVSHARVTLDKLSGVAGFRCQACGTYGEPIPARF